MKNPTEHTIKKLDLDREYTKLSQTTPNTFFAIPLLSRYFHIFQKDNDDIMKLQIKKATTHQMKYFDFEVNIDSNILTFSIDGLVSIHDYDSKSIIYTYISHHRSRYGIKMAKISTLRKHILTLGHDESLILMRIKSDQIIHEKSNFLRQFELNFSYLRKSMDIRISNYMPDNLDDCWTDVIARKVRSEEDKLYADVKTGIIENLNILKEQIGILLDKNEQIEDENEILPIQAFNLDEQTTEAIVEEARMERVDVQQKLHDVIEEKNSICDWIKENYWNDMTVKGSKVR